MEANTFFDISIIGGGLAGLSLSIQLKKMGYSVALFEKEQYPFHKVCGEYISLESWPFIESLGVPLSTMQLPIIKNLLVSAPNGNTINHTLPLGGFGISRHLLDNELKKIAEQLGVQVYENTKVEDVDFANDLFTIKTNQQLYTSNICLGSFGKRSNVDVKWQRKFILNKQNKLNNYIGVKYHIQTNFPIDTIALHNFKNGYCGISKIEGNKYCLCYLTTATNLKSNNNSIELMEKNVLQKNPFLQNILANCTHLYQQPLTISQISFDVKTKVHNHILLIGDAAGMITPLCGNGMSMALHGSKIAAGLVNDFLQHKTDRQTLETTYAQVWQQHFGKRLLVGRLIQRMFGKNWTTNVFVGCMKKVPAITNWLIQQTHGKPF
jgi:menaquinone-9 beta-reductase